jgi:hypothetical protein
MCQLYEVCYLDLSLYYLRSNRMLAFITKKKRLKEKEVVAFDGWLHFAKTVIASLHQTHCVLQADWLTCLWETSSSYATVRRRIILHSRLLMGLETC